MHHDIAHRLLHYAVQNHLLLEFNYNNEGWRIAEPYCLGLTTADHVALRAYQLRGHTQSIVPEWKLFDLSKVSELKLLAQEFDPKAREGYNIGDKAMKTIYIQIY